jgi:hypothetical protein
MSSDSKCIQKKQKSVRKRHTSSTNQSEEKISSAKPVEHVKLESAALQVVEEGKANASIVPSDCNVRMKKFHGIKYEAIKMWYFSHGGPNGDKRENTDIIKRRAEDYPDFPSESAKLTTWLDANPKAYKDFLKDTTIYEGFSYETDISTVIALRVILFLPLAMFSIATIWGNIDVSGIEGAANMTIGNVTIPLYFQASNPGLAIPALWIQLTESVFRMKSPIKLSANLPARITDCLQAAIGGLFYTCGNVICCRVCSTPPERRSSVSEEANRNNNMTCETSGINTYGWIMYTATAGMITYNLTRTGWGLIFSLLMGLSTYIIFPLLFLQFSGLIVARHRNLSSYQYGAIGRGLLTLILVVACAAFAAFSWTTNPVQSRLAVRIFSRDIAIWFMFYECLVTSKAVSFEDLSVMQVVAMFALFMNLVAMFIMFAAICAARDPIGTTVDGLNYITCSGWAIAGFSSVLGFYLRVWQQGSELREHERWHFFISHYQATGGNQANVMCLELQKRGYKVWYDNKMKNLTSEGMREGVRDSAVFVLFLSKGVFMRPYVKLEVMEALNSDKPIILVHETDARFGSFAFQGEEVLDEEYKKIVHELLLQEYESIGWERRDFKLAAVLTRIVNQFKNRPRKRKRSSTLEDFKKSRLSLGLTV